MQAIMAMLGQLPGLTHLPTKMQQPEAKAEAKTNVRQTLSEALKLCKYQMPCYLKLTP
jgi:hypothetical protein